MMSWEFCQLAKVLLVAFWKLGGGLWEQEVAPGAWYRKDRSDGSVTPGHPQPSRKGTFPSTGAPWLSSTFPFPDGVPLLTMAAFS